MNDVQMLIDELAQRLGRPVGVDDRRFRAIAYSSHPDEIDAVRRRSILGRQAPEHVTRWLECLGLARARAPIHVPANPEFDMVARVSVPVRFHDHLLGYVWLVDDGGLSDEDLSVSEQLATKLGEELYRERQRTSDERRLESQWVQQVLQTGRAEVSLERNGVAPDAVYAALVVSVALPNGAQVPVGVDVRMVEAVDQARRATAPSHLVSAVGVAQVSVVLSAANRVEVERHAAALHAAVVAETVDLPDVSVFVGVGDPVDDIGHLPISAAGARHAVKLGARVPELGGLVLWSELGVMRLLAELLGDRDPAEFVPMSLRRLLTSADGELLVRTLEAYLEHGGDVAAAAAELYLHRSSLYHRLRRVEEITGVDIRSGADRLELHLGLRLWHMAGAEPAGPRQRREKRSVEQL